jgi:hypothetical protein
MKLSACAVLALLITAPALAAPDYTHNGQTPNNSGVGSAATDSLQGLHPHKDTCEELLARAGTLTDPTSPDRADDARHEVMLAQDARDDGNAVACKRHAIRAIEDRT